MLDRTSSDHMPHDGAHDASHGSLKTYIIGFVLSFGLTVLSFAAVMSGLVPHDMILATITILAAAQLLVQLLFFLHLGTAPEQRSNTVIFVMAMILIAAVVGGSVWVMHNANVNMMPTQMTVERAISKD